MAYIKFVNSPFSHNLNHAPAAFYKSGKRHLRRNLHPQLTGAESVAGKGHVVGVINQCNRAGSMSGSMNHFKRAPAQLETVAVGYRKNPPTVLFQWWNINHRIGWMHIEFREKPDISNMVDMTVGSYNANRF